MINDTQNIIEVDNNNRSEKRTLESFIKIISKGITPYLIITACLFGLYFQTLSYGLINLDDDIIIKNNLVHVDNMSSIKKAFTRDAFYSNTHDYYRPILTLSFIFNKVTTGENLFYFHLTNLILHILFCCLVFYFLNLININRSLSLLLSLIFGVHPLFVNSVLWLVARSDLFVSVFLLSAFIMLIKYEDKKNIIYLIFHFIFFILSLFSKEIAIVAPAIFIIYLTRFKFISIIRKENIIYISLWILLIIPFIIIRHSVIGNLEHVKFSHFIFNLPLIPELLYKFFLPFNLSGLPVYNFTFVIIGIIFIICLLFLFYRHINSNFLFFLSFGLIWIIAFFVPGMFSKYMDIGGFDYLECRAYFPFLGLFIFLAFILNQIVEKKSKLQVILVFIILFSGIGSFIYSQNYSDPFKFYDTIINNGTKVAIAYYNRGVIKNVKKDIFGARVDYTKAIELKPDFTDALINRGIIKMGQGEYDAALQDLDSAVKSRSNYSLGYYNRGEIKYNLGDLKGAIEDYNRAIGIDSIYIEAFMSRGSAKMKLGDTTGAKSDFFNALELNPNTVKAYDYLGLCHLNSKEYKKVISYFEKTVKK